MAAPDYVPTDPVQNVRAYRSPPRRPGSWVADRPGDLTAGQPSGALLGSQGPDQGYALKLANDYDDEELAFGRVDPADAVAVAVAIANKRAALFGRAPVIHDLTAAFTVLGFLDDDPDDDLVAWREAELSQLSSSHHYIERRALVDRVPTDVIGLSPAALRTRYDADWRQNLELEPGGRE